MVQWSSSLLLPRPGGSRAESSAASGPAGPPRDRERRAGQVDLGLRALLTSARSAQPRPNTTRPADQASGDASRLHAVPRSDFRAAGPVRSRPNDLQPECSSASRQTRRGFIAHSFLATSAVVRSGATRRTSSRVAARRAADHRLLAGTSAPSAQQHDRRGQRAPGSTRRAWRSASASRRVCSARRSSTDSAIELRLSAPLAHDRAVAAGDAAPPIARRAGSVNGRSTTYDP